MNIDLFRQTNRQRAHLIS